MCSTDELIKSAQAAQSRNLPVYAKELIYDLARALDRQNKYAEGVRERAAKEVDEVRALLAEGPEDSDTFMSLPHTLVGDDETEYRPIGKGTTVEFRSEGMEPGEGFEVSIEGGLLHVRGANILAVVPENHTSLWIEAR